MKTITTKFTLALTIAIVITAYFGASAKYISSIGNTKGNAIAVKNTNSIYEKAVSINFNFDEEEYINDIPFDSSFSSVELEYQKAVAVDFELEEESYIDDIPFNTQKTVL